MGGGLAPLRNVAFRRLVAGQLASGVGDAFYAVALPWYVLASHGGPLLLGTVLAVYGVSRTVVLAIGGHAADRFRPWTVMLWADLVRAGALVAFAVVAATARPSFALLAPTALVLGIGAGLFLPASSAIIPALVEDEQLQAGNALSSGTTQLSSLLGPAAGGPVVAVLGSSTAFSVDAVTFMVSVVSLVGVRRALRARALGALAGRADGDGDGGVDGDADAGSASESGPAVSLRRLARDQPVLITMLLTSVVANLVLGGMGEVGLAALVRGPLHAGAGGYGVVIAVFGAGALAGTLAAAQTDRLRRPAIIGSLTFLVGAALVAVVPYLGGIVGAGAAMCAFGITLGFGNVILDTALMRWAPRQLLGRVMGLLMLGGYGVFPVSALIAGFVVHSFGAAVLFPLSGASIGVAVLGALTRRSWREFGMEESATVGSPGPQAA